VDGSLPLAAADRQALKELAGQKGLAVINKADLSPRISETALQRATAFPRVKISALTGQGLDDLKQAIVDLALRGGLSPAGEMITQARHHQHLKKALKNLNQAQALLGPTPPWELVALELKEAVQQLGEITGEEVGDEVLDRIFAQFCLGK
jgi:tRNA modification GTPase